MAAAAPAAIVHLGFDMGIRNLAYCLISHASTGEQTVLAWDNVDLLEGGVTAQAAKHCSGCGVVARWMGPDGAKWCQACATGIRRRRDAVARPAHPTLSCALTVKALRAAIAATGAPVFGDGSSRAAATAKKDALIAWARANYLLPWKPAKATQASLTDICNAMDRWLDTLLPTFASATVIRLENQPVMKGPTMKSVQILLFALLSHRLSREHGWSGRIEFVHAGNKTRGNSTAVATAAGAAEEDGGAAYRARKKTAEAEVTERLARGGERTAAWLAFFTGRSKKSDLADAYLMASASS